MSASRLSTSAVAVLAVLFIAACGETPTQPTAPADGLAPQMDQTGVVHFASVGSPDICEALGLPTGCGSNFSLVAVQRADGRVSGQWEDAGAPSNIHVAVDCLVVVGNIAIIGGVITHGQPLGTRAATEVVDNGTSTGDTPDQISLTINVPAGWDCEFLAENHLDDFPLFDLAHGQVTVR